MQLTKIVSLFASAALSAAAVAAIPMNTPQDAAIPDLAVPSDSPDASEPTAPQSQRSPSAPESPAPTQTQQPTESRSKPTQQTKRPAPSKPTQQTKRPAPSKPTQQAKQPAPSKPTQQAKKTTSIPTTAAPAPQKSKPKQTSAAPKPKPKQTSAAPKPKPKQTSAAPKPEPKQTSAAPKPQQVSDGSRSNVATSNGVGAVELSLTGNAKATMVVQCDGSSYTHVADVQDSATIDLPVAGACSIDLGASGGDLTYESSNATSGNGGKSVVGGWEDGSVDGQRRLSIAGAAGLSGNLVLHIDTSERMTIRVFDAAGTLSEVETDEPGVVFVAIPRDVAGTLHMDVSGNGSIGPSSALLGG